ncbi:nitrile hydratase accessory protein [Chromatiales bacterium (ex Bugula neritina AB1)]|nr:nitrile hydratase accessory protein [Chromatiales bacterium (ex Bugula neritina AB1)]
MNIDQLHRLPMTQGEPVFEEPWQARTFAMAVQLHQSGLFSWNEWAEQLAQCIAQREQSQQISSSGDYYTEWQTALEMLVAEKLMNR